MVPITGVSSQALWRLLLANASVQKEILPDKQSETPAHYVLTPVIRSMIPRNTLVRFYEDEDRRRIFLTGEEIEDDLLDATIEELRSLPKPHLETGGEEASA